MRLNERLSKDNRKKEEEKKRKKQDFYVDEEETLSYMPYTSKGYINDNKGVYGGFGSTGINNAPSIYDKQAVFRTRKE